MQAKTTAVTVGEEGQSNDHQRKWIILATVALGTFMGTLDSSIVNIALPTIRHQLNAGDSVQWVVQVYLLTITSTLLIMGRLSDLLGRRRVYVGGFALFTVASLLCGFAWDLWSLVAFRLLQGLGSAMIFAIGPAIIADTFTPRERGQALGWVGTVVAAGSSAGPVIGGLLLGSFGWPSIFFVNVPVGIFAVWRAWKIIPEGGTHRSRRFDATGAVLFALGVICLLLALDFGSQRGWGSSLVIGLFVGAAVLLGSFFAWEGRVREPMLNLSLFRIWPYTAALAAVGLSFTASAANLFVLPFYLQTILGYPPEQAGFILLAGPLALLVVSPLGGRLADRFGARWVASGGSILVAIGYFLLAGLQASWVWQDVVWRLVLLSVGFGLFQSPNNASALNAAPVAERGIASSMIPFMRNFGLVLGIAVGAAVWYSQRAVYASSHALRPEDTAAQIVGLQIVYYMLTGLLLLSASISLSRGKLPMQEEPPLAVEGQPASFSHLLLAVRYPNVLHLGRFAQELLALGVAR